MTKGILEAMGLGDAIFRVYFIIFDVVGLPLNIVLIYSLGYGVKGAIYGFGAAKQGKLLNRLS